MERKALLSHFNIDSNVEAVAQVFGIQPDDGCRFFTRSATRQRYGSPSTTAWCCHHPLDAVPIGTLTKRYRVTFLVATPTFLQLYLRRCTPSSSVLCVRC